MLFGIRSRPFFLLLAAFLICTIIALSEATFESEKNFMELVQDSSGNAGVDMGIWLITESGNVFVMLPFSIVLLIIRRTRRIGMTLLILIVISTILTGYIKCGVDRDRPFDYALSHNFLTFGDLQMPSIRKKIEKKNDRKLTNRQMTFSRHIVEGIYSNTECARKAGYSQDLANEYASRLLNGRDYPHVLEYITELRQERERRYGVTTIGQLERLHKLSLNAEDSGQFSAAINAEKIRSALGGLTIDRRETINTLDQLSRDEITARLLALQKQYPQAFVVDAEFEEVKDAQRVELLETDKKQSA